MGGGERFASMFHVARTLPCAAASRRAFQTSVPRQGLVSTVGWAGLTATFVAPAAMPDKYEQLKPDEYKTLAFLGGMVVFGGMVKMGGSKEEAAAPAEDFDFEAFMKEIEKES